MNLAPSPCAAISSRRTNRNYAGALGMSAADTPGSVNEAGSSVCIVDEAARPGPWRV